MLLSLLSVFAFAANLCADLTRVTRYQQDPTMAQNEVLGTSVGHPSDFGEAKDDLIVLVARSHGFCHERLLLR